MTDERQQSESCIFCRIVSGELGTEFVAESEMAVAFHDLHPAAPTHVLVVPRRHVPSLRNLQDPATAADLLLLANRVAKEFGLTEGGYRVVANDGPDAGQTVDHLHFHVLGGHKLNTALA
jgi:histidine triad (HIT) family protein